MVNDFADYGGLKSAPEIADRRLTLIKPSDIEYRQVIEPDEVITWVDINGNERPMGPTSWANELEAACAKICNHLSHITNRKSIVVVNKVHS